VTLILIRGPVMILLALQFFKCLFVWVVVIISEEITISKLKAPVF